MAIQKTGGPLTAGKRRIAVDEEVARDVEINIFRGERKEDQHKVVVRANGRRFEIERGHWVRVPISVLYALQDAVVEKLQRVRPEERGERVRPWTINTVWIEVEIPRFQYQWREVQEQVAVEEDRELEPEKIVE